MTSKLAYSTVQCSAVQHRRGKREEGEEPVSKHQIRPGDGRWTGRRGVGRLNPRRENKLEGNNGDVCMYVCMVIAYSRVWINRVRLPILLVVS